MGFPFWRRFHPVIFVVVDGSRIRRGFRPAADVVVRLGDGDDVVIFVDGGWGREREGGRSLEAFTGGGA